jgi:type III secretion protein C
MVQVQAAPLNLPQGPYPYRIVDQDLAAVLQEFGHNLGLRVITSPRVSGKVQGRIPGPSALEFLNNLCRLYGLDWYYDGAALYVTASTEEVTRFLRLKKETTFESLTDSLKKLSLYDERYPIKGGPDNGSVLISGPPAYVAIIEQTLSSTSAGGYVEPPSATVIYRGPVVTVEKFEVARGP